MDDRPNVDAWIQAIISRYSYVAAEFRLTCTGTGHLAGIFAVRRTLLPSGTLPGGALTRARVRFDDAQPVRVVLAIEPVALSTALLSDDLASYGVTRLTWLVGQLAKSNVLRFEFNTLDGPGVVRFDLGGNTRDAIAVVFRACGRRAPWEAGQPSRITRR